jgi:hypothetical protein
MTPKSTKLSVHIESDRLSSNVKGEFTITDILFSDLTHADGMDGKQIIKDVKQCIKALKGFNMLTIRLTDGEQYSAYPQEIDSVRFTRNSYQEYKMSYVNRDRFEDWVESDEKHIYTIINKFVHDANALHSKNRKAQQLTAQ